jgi:hypothetical protein
LLSALNVKYDFNFGGLCKNDNTEFLIKGCDASHAYQFGATQESVPNTGLFYGPKIDSSNHPLVYQVVLYVKKDC